MSQAHKWKKLSNCRFPMVEIHPKPNLAWFHIEIFYISLLAWHVPMIWKLKTVNREPVGGLKCPRTARDLFMGSTPSPNVFSTKMVIKMSCLFSITFQEDRTASLTSERQSKRQQIRNAAQAWASGKRSVHVDFSPFPCRELHQSWESHGWDAQAFQISREQPLGPYTELAEVWATIPCCPCFWELSDKSVTLPVLPLCLDIHRFYIVTVFPQQIDTVFRRLSRGSGSFHMPPLHLFLASQREFPSHTLWME